MHCCLHRTLLIISLLLLLSSTLAAQPEGINITSNGNSYIVNFNIPEYQVIPTVAEGEEYNDLIIPAYGVSSYVGLPALPIVTFNLFISDKENQPDYKIISTSSEDRVLQNKIFPFQKPWEKSKPLSDRPFTIDRNYYKSSGSENQSSVTISKPFILGGIKGVMITINPFKYDPSENKLSVINSLSFEITLSYPAVPPLVKSEGFSSFLKNAFINYDGLNSGGNVNYLIITSPAFEECLAQFVDYKNSNGYNVESFTTNVTGTSNASIKNFIQQRYDNIDSRPEYILLVGDVASIPAWTGSGTGTPMTDLKYALLEGNDNFADAFIGRFSVSTVEELQHAIDKSIYMESNIGTLEKKNVFMASTDNWQISEATHNYVIENYFDPAGYQNEKLYTHSYGANTQQLVSELNSNQLFAIYSGHGSTSAWIDGPLFTQPNIRNLTNSWFPFVYSFACQTGAYYLPECFGETWIRAQNGASTFYGSSVDSYWDQDDLLEKKVSSSIFEDELETVSQSFFQGMIYLVNYYGGVNGTTLRYMEMYNLMGDPSMPVSKKKVNNTASVNPINDLDAINPTSNSITLNWTTPFDSASGIIAEYDIRYSPTAINNDDDFNNAPQRLLTEQSDTAGTIKFYTIDELDFNTSYYFAVKAKDEWGNISEISNLAQLETLSAPEFSVDKDSLHLVVSQNSFYSDSIIISNVSLENSTLDYLIELKDLSSAGLDYIELSQREGSLYNGESSAVIININSTSLEAGEYRVDMVINTNDPDWQEVTIPMTITVSEDSPSGVNNDLSKPTEFALLQNYPNPFNPTTTISFALPTHSSLIIAVYNSVGEKVTEIFNGDLDVGYHRIEFDASSLPSGVYFYRFESEKFIAVKKMIIMK